MIIRSNGYRSRSTAVSAQYLKLLSVIVTKFSTLGYPERLDVPCWFLGHVVKSLGQTSKLCVDIACSIFRYSIAWWLLNLIQRLTLEDEWSLINFRLCVQRSRSTADLHLKCCLLNILCYVTWWLPNCNTSGCYIELFIYFLLKISHFSSKHWIFLHSWYEEKVISGHHECLCICGFLLLTEVQQH